MGLSFEISLSWIFANCLNPDHVCSKFKLHNIFSYSEFVFFYIKHNYLWSILWYFCKINSITEHLGLRLLSTTIGLRLLHSWNNNMNSNRCYLDAKGVLQWWFVKTQLVTQVSQFITGRVVLNSQVQLSLTWEGLRHLPHLSLVAAHFIPAPADTAEGVNSMAEGLSVSTTVEHTQK